MITAARSVLQRVSELSLRDALIAGSVLVFVGAIAWLGLTVSRLIDEMRGAQLRLRDLEARMSRQERRHRLLLTAGWRDSQRRTAVAESSVTVIDWRRP